MPKLQLLTPSAQVKFDDCPSLTAQQRHVYFSIEADIASHVEKIREPTNKVGFVLQLGYFRAAGKFFASELFKKADIKFVCNALDVKLQKYVFDPSTYIPNIKYIHKSYILKKTGWQKFSKKHDADLHTELSLYAKQQRHPKALLPIATNYLINHKIELPMYYILAEIVSDVYNKTEESLVDAVDKALSQNQKAILDDLIWFNRKNSKHYKYSILANTKQFSFSTKVDHIKDSVETYKLLKTFYIEFANLYNKLELSENATSYYSQWVTRAKLFQLKQFKNRAKAYLYLLAHIKHQYFRHTDLYVDILLKLVSNANNRVRKTLDKHNALIAHKQKMALEMLTVAHKDSEKVLHAVLDVVDNQQLDSDAKVAKTRNLVMTQLDSKEYKQIAEDDVINLMEKYATNKDIKAKLLRAMGASLQRKLTPIISILGFDVAASAQKLSNAISSYALADGKVEEEVDLTFIGEQEAALVVNDKKKTVDVLAYKAILFSKSFAAIKAGQLNLLHSYKYLQLRRYLLDEARWQEKALLLQSCGLNEFLNMEETIELLNTRLNEKYQKVNLDYKQGRNKYLSFNKQGRFVIATPKALEPKIKNRLAPVFSGEGIIPIARVLDDINKATNFVDCFKHHAIKKVIMKPTPETIYAGVLSKGCNLGVTKMANISKGITIDTLNNTVTWFFSLENLQNANNSVIEYIDKLPLPCVYQLAKNYSHTSSDGQKFNVGVDSILANYSFKYFGQAQGISVYSFIDDRQTLFYSTVISPGEREAAFVLDGLLANSVVNSHMHSTDTHGYSEAIFAMMYLLGFSFAPRIKKLGAQKLYCIDSKKKYSKDGNAIKFSSKVNLNLIKSNWDDILRLAASIKTKTSTASQIFKRLNSYTKEPQLYKALKEFGRIIKTIYILTYLDDVALRQRIEKQLNRIESSNKFAKAVFFANAQEFRAGSTEEQMLIVACRVFIQNCIVLWNYLYLSQVLAEQNDYDRKFLLQVIKKSSVICWRHINLHGEYDFRAAASDPRFGMFDLGKIIKLNVL